MADMTFDERLAMIVDAEWDARRVNKRTRLLRQAGFPEPEANVADVHYDPDRKLDKVKITELSNCEWIRNHRNVLLTGASGAGNYGKFRIMLRNGLPPQVACARQPRPFA